MQDVSYSEAREHLAELWDRVLRDREVIRLVRRDRGADPEGERDQEVTRLAVFQPEFREDLRWWTREQPRVADRIWGLIEEIMRASFTGTGKPERLRYLGPNVWSRRITQEHRLVCLVREERIDFLQGRYHY